MQSIKLIAALGAGLVAFAAASDPPSNDCSVTDTAAQIITGWTHVTDDNASNFVSNSGDIPTCSQGDWLYRKIVSDGSLLIFCGSSGNLCCWKSLGKTVQGPAGGNGAAGTSWQSCNAG